MSRSVHAQLYSYTNVEAACRLFLRDTSNAGAAGYDGVTVQSFSENLVRYAREMHADAQREYRFSPLKPICLKKPDGKSYRIICIPTVRDRIMQRILVDYFMSHPQAAKIRNPVSFGFMPSVGKDRRGVGAARDAALKLRKDHRFAYKSDICKFFDNIPRDVVLAKTTQLFRSGSLHPLFGKIVSCEADSSDKKLNRILQSNGLVPGRGLRQGMPASPLFSNIVLERFDREMTRRGFHMVRYADDFIVFCQSEHECLRVDQAARELLQAEGLEIPPLASGSKTRIAAPHEAIDFLGLSIEEAPGGGYRLIITDKQLQLIRDSLSKLSDIDHLASNKMSLPDAIRKISNMRSGYVSAYKIASNFSSIEKAFSNAERIALRDLYERAFGKSAVSKINSRAAMVLGLVDFPTTRS